MLFEKVIEILKKEYERAQKLTYVHKPLAFALYQTWKKVDRKEKYRRSDEIDKTHR